MFHKVSALVNSVKSVVRQPVVNLEASKEIWEELNHLDIDQKGISHDTKSQRNTINVE